MTDQSQIDRILQHRQNKAMTAAANAISMQASTMIGAMQTKIVMLEARVAQLERLVAKLDKKKVITDGQ